MPELSPGAAAYRAGPDDAAEVARLLHDFNTEFDAPTPGHVTLAERLELYVAPQHRGHGLGSAIIHRLVSDAVDMGVSVIEINVDPEDVDAQRFYERHRFSGRDPDTGGRAFYYALEL